MKICFIGGCGHSENAYSVAKARNDAVLAAIAPGPFGEKIPEGYMKELKRYENYIEMLESEKPEVCVVSPIFVATAKVASDCAARGINVFSEKPVASTIEELDLLQKAVINNKINFSAMHYLRFDPAFYTGAVAARSGIIGNIVMVNAQKSYKYGKRPSWYSDRNLYGGTIPWVGIHGIDWIYSFTGKKFLTVTATACGNPEKTALCQYRLEDGILASLNMDYFRPEGAPTHGDDYVRCVGDKGIIEVRYGKVRLIKDGIKELDFIDNIPDLFGDFLDGKQTISPEEIFYLTRVSLLSRDSADKGKTIEIGGQK